MPQVFPEIPWYRIGDVVYHYTTISRHGVILLIDDEKQKALVQWDGEGIRRWTSYAHIGALPGRRK